MREVSPTTRPGMRLLMAWESEKAVKVERNDTSCPTCSIEHAPAVGLEDHVDQVEDDDQPDEPKVHAG